MSWSVLPFLLGSTLLLFQLFWRPSLPSPFPLRPAPLAHAGVLVGEGGAIVVGLWLRLRRLVCSALPSVSIP